MRHFYVLLTSLVVLGIAGRSYAQTSFSDGFETSSEIQNWTLNHGPLGSNLTNKWPIS